MRSYLRAAKENATSLMSIETGTLGCEAPIEKRHCQQFSRKVFELESYPRPKLFNRAASSSLTQATVFQKSAP